MQLYYFMYKDEEIGKSVHCSLKITSYLDKMPIEKTE